MVDWFGQALEQVYSYGENQCNLRRSNRSFSVSPDIPSNAFYFQSYLTIGRATGANLAYQSESNNPDLNGNLPLTRADAAVILNRYFFRPIEMFTQQTSSSNTILNLASSKSPFIIASKSLSQIDSPYLNIQPINYSKLQRAQLTSVEDVPDVSPDQYYYKDIQKMVEKWGVLELDFDGTFRPDQPITREELAKLLEMSFNQVDQLMYGSCEKSNSTGSEENNSANYGAIAYSDQLDEFGFSQGSPTQSKAESAAIQRCFSSDCRIVLSYMSGFGATARANDRAWGAAWGETLEEAEQAAVTTCKEYSQNPDTCSVIHSR
jgi:hypothetical protein